MPTTEYDDYTVEELYEKIQLIINRTPKRNFLLLQGDFTAKVGKLPENYPSQIRKYTYGENNERGSELSVFVLSII